MSPRDGAGVDLRRRRGAGTIAVRRLGALASLTAISLSFLAASACSSGSSNGQGGEAPGSDASTDDAARADGSTDDDGGANYAPTFTAIWSETLMTTCALLFCHGGSDDFLSMSTKDIAYASMVGVVSHGPMCGQSGLTIVSPGDPDASLLYLKITNPPCGNKMPAQYGLSVDDQQIEQIRQWIALGARDD